MTDVLIRFQAALPRVRGWIDHLLDEQSPRSTPVGSLGLERLTSYFPEPLLRDALAVVVPHVPFPPVSAYGLPEFEALAAMPMAGITFRNMIFVRRSHSLESVYFHELIHVVQWAALGVNDFLLTYGVGVLQFGYERSPLEAVAYRLQDQFEQGIQIHRVFDVVASDARAARAATAELFHQYGLRMGP